MRKYYTVLLVLIGSSAFACDFFSCQYLLDIIIKNNTNSECHLIQHKINSGRFGADLVFDKELAHISTIAAGQKSKAFRFYDDVYYRHHVVLTYQCGDDKFITLDSTRNAYAGITMPLLGMWTVVINGLVTSASNMDASYESDIGSCTRLNPPARPGSITWTLS